MAEWAEMSFGELSRRYEDLVRGIRADLATLAEVGPALTAKAAELGMAVSLDYSALAAAATDLVPRLGYAKAAEIADRALSSGRSIAEIMADGEDAPHG